MTEKKFNTGELDDLVEEFSEPYENDVDRMIEEIRRDLDQDTPDYPQSTPDTQQPEMTEFRDQEYLDTFGDHLPSGFTDEDPAEEMIPETEEEMQPMAQKPIKKAKKKKKKKLKRRGSAVFVGFSTIIYIALVAAAALILAKFAWMCADDVLALTKPDQTVSVTIPKDATLDDITDALYEAKLINYPWLFEIYGKVAHVEDRVNPGTYELNTLYDYHAIVNGLSSRAARATVQVTLIEGYSCKQIFKLLEDAQVCTAAELENAAANADFSDYWFVSELEKGEPNRLEGYLYPDTYEFYTYEDPEVVLSKILDNFEYRIDDSILEEVNASGYSLRQILTIASIIEEEAASVGERPDIASVIYNRLNSTDLRYLQMDSTVYYAAELLGVEFDTDLDSPYNTYFYEGLPAGPIDNPGMECILAALNPNDTSYYYFAYGTDGVSHFYSDFDSFSAFLESDEYAG